MSLKFCAFLLPTLTAYNLDFITNLVSLVKRPTNPLLLSAPQSSCPTVNLRAFPTMRILAEDKILIVSDSLVLPDVPVDKLLALNCGIIHMVNKTNLTCLSTQVCDVFFPQSQSPSSLHPLAYVVVGVLSTVVALLWRPKRASTDSEEYTVVEESVDEKHYVSEILHYCRTHEDFKDKLRTRLQQ